jgi:hypothetical protein
MFKENTGKVELLKSVESLQSSQIIKHYLPDYTTSQRNSIVSAIRQSITFFTKEALSKGLFDYVTEYEMRKSEDLPDLIYSIVMNSLAFEANEKLKEGMYKDYMDPTIRKHGKSFIAGQYKMFAKSYESLYYTAEEQVKVVETDIKDIVILFLDACLTDSQSVSDLEKILTDYKNNK